MILKRGLFWLGLLAIVLGLLTWPGAAQKERKIQTWPTKVKEYLQRHRQRPRTLPKTLHDSAEKMLKLANRKRPFRKPSLPAGIPGDEREAHADYYDKKFDEFSLFQFKFIFPKLTKNILEPLPQIKKMAQVLGSEWKHITPSEYYSYQCPSSVGDCPDETEAGIGSYLIPLSGGQIVACAKSSGGYEELPFLDHYAMFCASLTAWKNGHIRAFVELQNVIADGCAFGPWSAPEHPSYYGKAWLVAYADSATAESSWKDNLLIHVGGPSPTANPFELSSMQFEWPSPNEPVSVMKDLSFSVFIGVRVQTSKPGDHGFARARAIIFVPDIYVKIESP